MLINNYLAISFLIVTIVNILNFDTHDCNCIPALFQYEYICNILHFEIKRGSIYCCNIHLHHWILGVIGIVLLQFFPSSKIKSLLEGCLLAVIIDGLLFSDRFVL